MTNIWKSIRHEMASAAATGFRKLPGRTERDLTSGPIRLFWWTDHKNFGDVLSPVIVRHLTGREVEWSSLAECDLCAIGSIYGWIRVNGRHYFRDVHFWGSGIKKPAEAVGPVTHMHHHLVRGPLTALTADDDSLPTGDPGLLAPEAVGVKQAKDAKGIGIIPHRIEWNRAEYIEALKALPGVRLIDYNSDDCTGIVEEMAACERIYSSSLHGLVVADALGIPNYRFVGRKFAGNGHHFKYFDYALSVGRDVSRPVDVFEHPKTGTVRPEDTAYLANIPAKKAEIAGSFPYHVFGGDPARAEALIKGLGLPG